MKILGRFVVADVFKSEKGNEYLTLVDLETGGQLKLTLQGTEAAVVPGQMLEADLVVRPVMSKFGQSVVYVAGSFAKKS